MKFVVGSASDRKVKIAEKIIKQFFANKDVAIQSYGAKSQMPDTPWDKQTYDGAKNRALDSKSHLKEYYGYSSGLKVPDFILKKMDSKWNTLV